MDLIDVDHHMIDLNIDTEHQIKYPIIKYMIYIPLSAKQMMDVMQYDLDV